MALYFLKCTVIILMIILVAYLFTGINCQPMDGPIYQDMAHGSAPVLLSVAKIQQSGVFGSDNDLLRRIAYVETRDGTLPDTFREGYNGGIWAVDEEAFLRTKDVTANRRLPSKLAQIEELFRIEWESVEWVELRKPFYSALAARLVLFNARRTIPSVNDLEGQAMLWAQHYNLDGSVSEFVSLSSGLEGSILESSGNEFFIGFASNYQEGSALLELNLFITTSEPEPVRFDITATGFSFTGVAFRNSSTRVILPNTLEVVSTTERDKGIYVKAEAERKIVVYGLSYQIETSDAFLALPCNTLAVDEYEYYSVAYTTLSPTLESLLLIVACEDNTVVSTPAGMITLDRLQTYQIASSTDLTGTRITSSKPISVFSSQECVFVPVETAACDFITEQIPPTSTWGNRFLIASLLGRNSGDRIRVLTSTQNSVVTITCNGNEQPVTINLDGAGNWTEFSIASNDYCIIEASSPTLVVQYALGQNAEPSGSVVGDPFMMMIPPIEQYSNSYVFDALSTFERNAITVYIAPEYFQPQDIFVDNTTIPENEWFAVNCTTGNRICGYITRVFITSGEHRLLHRNPSARVGVSAYGFNNFNSYGYPGGLKLVPVQLATVSFSSQSYRTGERGGNRQVQIVRSGAIDIEAIVLVGTDSFEGTAAAGADYVVQSEIIVFQPGETVKNVSFEVLDDKRIETSETFEFYLIGGAGVHLSPFSRATVTIEDNDGMILLNPSYGNMLGGTCVIVTLTGSQTIREENDISCFFDGIKTQGVFLTEKEALCVTPLLAETGRLNFTLLVSLPESNIAIFAAESIFTSISYTKAFEVYIGNEDLIFSSGTNVRVQWSPESIFPMEPQDSYTVDIDLLEMNARTGRWQKLRNLASNVPNTGVASVSIPEVEEEDGISDLDWQQSYSTVIVRVGLSNASTSEPETGVKRRSISSVFRAIGRAALKIVKNSPMRFLKKLARQAIQRVLCEIWGGLQSSSTGNMIRSRLPPCPTRIRDIMAPNSGFTEERLSSVVPVVGRVQDFFGTTIIDDGYRNYFHPGTANCFRQRVRDRSLTGGSGQQCCYGRDGLLITGAPGGGTVDLVSPDVSIVGHFVQDVVPFLLCCKAGFFSNCDKYYEHRPSDPGFDYSPPPPPAVMLGDPHIITLDGNKYTFNGKGEFTLIEMEDGSITFQGRMVPVDSATGNDSLATVFTAVVAKQIDSDIVQFEVTENGTIVVVNGEEIDFSELKEQEFNNVTVADLGNSSYSASFSSGAYFEVKEENDFFSVLIVSLPASFRSGQSYGLMGSFNGNSSDDLLPKLGLEPLPVNSTLQEIHELFGVTWIVDTPRDSLFTYQPGESWTTYYDPFFIPAYQPVFSDPELESQASDVCGDDVFCLFDIAATGLVDIGISTVETGNDYEEILELQIPVVCTVPCENGVCVANDTCKCSEGYSGTYCTEPVYTECEESPCQNGGSCTQHVISFFCECPPTHNGSLCEIEVVIIQPPSEDNTGIIIGAVFGALGGILLVGVVVALVVVIAMKTVRTTKSKPEYSVTMSSVSKTENMYK